MSILECVAAVQTKGPDTPMTNPRISVYFVIALVAVVLALVVWMFVRTSGKGSPEE